jgi:hypothetical protein
MKMRWMMRWRNVTECGGGEVTDRLPFVASLAAKEGSEIAARSSYEAVRERTRFH